jgi:hypothetical protein
METEKGQSMIVSTSINAVAGIDLMERLEQFWNENVRVAKRLAKRDDLTGIEFYYKNPVDKMRTTVTIKKEVYYD